MEGNPQISVIVPAYNKPEYLPECLQSIQNQTFQDWECIVVSDGSPRVEEIRAAVAAMGDERFRLVEHRENRGLAAARNTGVREARAELVICVDEDDRILPRCLEEEFRRMSAGGGEIVCCGVEFFGGRKGRRRTSVPTLEEILRSQPLVSCGFLMGKSTWQRLGGWDEHPILRIGREDSEWWIRVIANGCNVEVLDEVLYEYRAPADIEEQHKSLDYRAMLREVRTRKYITRKHAALYNQFPQARRAYLREAYLREANCLAAQGRQFRAVLHLWVAACVSRYGKDFKAALRAAMDLCLGSRVTERLLAWRRRLLRFALERK